MHVTINAFGLDIMSLGTRERRFRKTMLSPSSGKRKRKAREAEVTRDFAYKEINNVQIAAECRALD